MSRRKTKKIDIHTSTRRTNVLAAIELGESAALARTKYKDEHVAGRIKAPVHLRLCTSDATTTQDTTANVEGLIATGKGASCYLSKDARAYEQCADECTGNWDLGLCSVTRISE